MKPDIRTGVAMTFAQQIENVPLNLVQQGFRLHPSESVWYRWQETEGVKDPHWQMVRLPDGTKVSRPVYEIAKGVVVYAHAGWGDGLTPTVEMVDVWRFWWVKRPDGFGIHQCDCGGQVYFGFMNLDWLGPCLPPADML